MRHAVITIRSLTLAELVDSAVEAQLYVEATDDDGVAFRRAKMLKLDGGGASARVPVLELEAVQDRSGATLIRLTATGDEALAWARRCAELDADAQMKAQTERRAAAAAAAARAAVVVEPTQLTAGQPAPGFTEHPSVQVYMTAPAPGVPIEEAGLDEFEEPPTPPATPPAKRKAKRS